MNERIKLITSHNRQCKEMKNSVDIKYWKMSSRKHHFLSTNNMEQWSTSRANTFLGSQEISRVVWSPKVHYRFHKSPSLVLVLSHTKAIPLSSIIFIFRHTLILSKYIFQYGRDSAVGIVITSVVRTPVGARFSTPVQTRPRTHRFSCTRNDGSFPLRERPRRGVEQPSLSSAEVKYG